MSAILCLALYYEGIVGPTRVDCIRVSLLERANAELQCLQPSCRTMWLGDVLWVHMLMGSKRSAGRAI